MAERIVVVPRKRVRRPSLSVRVKGNSVGLDGRPQELRQSSPSTTGDVSEKKGFRSVLGGRVMAKLDEFLSSIFLDSQ